MRYLDEFRDHRLADGLVREIKKITSEKFNFMEVCGTHTVTILRTGIKELLRDEVNLISGPGCPVCVTPIEILDKAITLAARPEVIFCSFGDMLRVPGSRKYRLGHGRLDCVTL